MTWTPWQQVSGDGLDFAEIIYEKKSHEELAGRIARISINRPAKMNAVTNATADEMFRAFYDANHDNMVGVIVLTSVGDHFGTGGDVDWDHRCILDSAARFNPQRDELGRLACRGEAVGLLMRRVELLQQRMQPLLVQVVI